MHRTLATVRFNFISRIRERLLVNLFSLLTFAVLIYMLISSGLRLPWLLLFYIVAYICMMNVDAVDKNVGLETLTDFPLTLREVLEILSFKIISASLVTGLVVLAAARLVMEFSLFEWVNILIAAIYFSLVFLFGIQLTLRGKLAGDPLSVLMLGAVIVAAALVWAVMYHLFAPLEAVATAALVAVYHLFIPKGVASSSADRVTRIMEKGSWTQ